MITKRNILKQLELYVKVFPVVLLTGARQTGKTTLAQEFGQSNGYSYITLDDSSTLLSAKRDPLGFLKYQPKPLIIDEVQRAPELFLAIKQIVDQEQALGQFILTGSANPLFLPKVGDSLAGRMGILRMHPFSQGELESRKEAFIPWIFSSDFKMQNFSEVNMNDLGNRIYKGGFPRVHSFQSNLEVDTWIEGYLQSIMDRDVKEISQVEGLYHFPDLFKLLAYRSGSLFNGADLARTLKISTASVHRYLALLEALFFIYREPAWFSNRAKRIAKAPKIYLCDTGILSYLLKANPETFQSDPSVFGFMLESFVASELLKQASWLEEKIEQHHYREDSSEVDIVLGERGGNIVGIEVKSASTIHSSDFKGILRLKAISKHQFVRGIILYSGSKMLSFGDNLWAIPISALWEA